MSLSRYADEDRLSRVSLRRCPYAILFHGVVKKDTEGTKGTNLVVHDFDCGEERFFLLLIVVVNCCFLFGVSLAPLHGACLQRNVPAVMESNDNLPE